MADSDSPGHTLPTPPLSPSSAPASRALRRAALGALAAELGHDLQGPVNLFRLAKERLARGETLDDEDVSSLDEELERLSRLSSRLRELARSTLQTVTCSPRELVECALRSAPLAVDAARLELELESSPALGIFCDPCVLGQAVRELLDNAIEARQSRAGVRFSPSDPSGLCVWDDGAGLELSVARAMSWGVTTRPSAAGLGLTLALRAARAHGFSLELVRRPPFTEAWLLIPARALRARPTAEPR